jgi:hypothetical protein
MYKNASERFVIGGNETIIARSKCDRILTRVQVMAVFCRLTCIQLLNVQPITITRYDSYTALRLPGCIILEPLREEGLDCYRQSGWAKLGVSFNNSPLHLLIQDPVPVSAQMQTFKCPRCQCCYENGACCWASYRRTANAPEPRFSLLACPPASRARPLLHSRVRRSSSPLPPPCMRPTDPQPRHSSPCQFL